MTRREALRLMGSAAGVGAASVWLPGCGQACSEVGSDPPAATTYGAGGRTPGPSGGARADVIVLGAGMAGLSATAALVERGRSVIVLEGRDHVGGRTRTDRSLGFAIDLGAHWIEGVRRNPVAELARQLGARTVEQNDEVMGFDHDGRRLDDETMEAIEERWERIERSVAREGERRPRDVSFESGVLRAVAGEELDAFERRALDWSMASLETDSAGELSRVTLIEADEGEGFGGASALLPDGYDQLPRALARRADVRTSHRVERVERSRSGVRVIAAGTTFEARAAVVTLPLGVLKAGHVAFAPQLPQRKRDAIARLEMGTLNKVALRFPRAQWPDEPHGFAYLSNLRGEFPEVLNWHALAGHPVLIAFTGGVHARAMEARTDADIVARLTAIYRSMFGSSLPQPTGHVITRWTRDPFTLGSYSFLAEGATPDDRRALAAPVDGNVFFAGEATNADYPATVHGAVLSGRRAAREVDDALG
ncbi:MAG: FAD-dependent oxidoreductase [Deltaproteobacteria bacterium]|nr:FAD-dependent oxidoreductase [Deltaproteobacteria bacterium]